MAPVPETFPDSDPDSGTNGTATSASEPLMSGYMGSSNTPYKATPVAAVVVPVILVIALIIGALLVAYYLYRRRARTDRDEIIAAATKQTRQQQRKLGLARPKRLPDWLSNWTGSLRARASGSGGGSNANDARMARTSPNGSLRKALGFGGGFDDAYELNSHSHGGGGKGRGRGKDDPEAGKYKLDLNASLPMYEDDTASDVIALRPTDLPAAPRPAYESHYHAFGVGNGLKPKLVVGL